MTELIPGIRVAVRALIERDGHVLVQHKVYDNGSERYTLPGGAPDLGETLEQGLRRECFEELGTTVEIDGLYHVADYFKPRDTDPPTKRQQVEIVFRCHVPQGYEAGNGPHPDKHQKDVLWINVSELSHKCFIPRGLSAVIGQSIPDEPEKLVDSPPVYLGLID